MVTITTPTESTYCLSIISNNKGLQIATLFYLRDKTRKMGREVVCFVCYFYYLCPMNFTGIIIGVATFLIIGLFHPLVIKGEYYFGVRCWWVFAVMGVAAVMAALFVDNVLFSTLLAVWGASSFWSIGELFEQRKRVEKGWFPKREKRD